ncbi:trehalose-phosphatase [Sphingomonas sp. LY54]|uniref:trehalose-phosphatase n=1 Tax=Sphingomonas sp. LY54 TaxID=3095343 RepID=UPI002D774743|nr:trehalose-phosphatase [Sphingomonas sp. LY54]WRP29274.1 trehalose-phosphatase [Sphingomonas sp. LY54]
MSFAAAVAKSSAMADNDCRPPLGLLDGAALFLDFDGTLVELAETPAAIRVGAHLEPLLHRLHARLEGRLAIVSGRAIADLEKHLDCAALAVSGSHGLELRLGDGTSLPLSVPPGLAEAKAATRAFAAGVPGLLVEEKPFGVALHYRQAPDAADAAEALMRDVAASTGLTLQLGKMVAELRPHGSDKGDALKAFMREPEFAGARPVFVGDDLTDEHAFAAAAELGGGGVLVGPQRETAARWQLPGVGAVAEWLSEASL